MFGGLAFLVGGNMAIAASGQGGVLVRVGPEHSDRLVASTKASVAVMRGRPMPGWLRVDAEDLRTKRQLGKWADLGVGFARSLPAKG
jgi:TfoX/Sxy family transcriptional regulator of competence genes